MKTIYYKNGQLDKKKTTIALIRYYIKAKLHGQKPGKIIVDSGKVLSSF